MKPTTCKKWKQKALLNTPNDFVLYTYQVIVAPIIQYFSLHL